MRFREARDRGGGQGGPRRAPPDRSVAPVRARDLRRRQAHGAGHLAALRGRPCARGRRARSGRRADPLPARRVAGGGRRADAVDLSHPSPVIPSGAVASSTHQLS